MSCASSGDGALRARGAGAFLRFFGPAASSGLPSPPTLTTTTDTGGRPSDVNNGCRLSRKRCPTTMRREAPGRAKRAPSCAPGGDQAAYRRVAGKLARAWVLAAARRVRLGPFEPACAAYGGLGDGMGVTNVRARRHPGVLETEWVRQTCGQAAYGGLGDGMGATSARATLRTTIKRLLMKRCRTRGRARCCRHRRDSPDDLGHELASPRRVGVLHRADSWRRRQLAAERPESPAARSAHP